MPETDDGYTYGMDGGRTITIGQGIWGMLSALLLAGFGLMLYALILFRGIQSPLVMEQADIARNLSEGHGFVTHVIRPLDLWLIETPAAGASGPIPALWQAPLYPRLLAWGFRLLRPAYGFSQRGLLDAETRVIIPLSIFLVLLTAVATWCLARAWFDERVASLAGIIVLVSPLPMHLVLEGGALPLTMLLAVILVWLVWKAVDRSVLQEKLWLVPVYALLAGTVGGLLVLSHYAAFLVVLAAGCWGGWNLQRLRWSTLGTFVIGVGLVLFPAMVAMRGPGGWVGMGYPYAALLNTVVYPADSLWRDGEPALRNWQVWQAIRDGVAMRHLALIDGRILSMGGFIMVFFLAGMFRREERHWQQNAKGIFATLLILLPILPILPGNAYGGWAMLFPFFVIFGVQTFFRMLDQEEYFDPTIRPLLTWALVILCLLPAGLRLLRPYAQSPYPPYHGPLQSYVCNWTGSDQMVVTDIPWATAWYGKKTSLLWPLKMKDVARYGSSVRAIYLAGPLSNQVDPAWQRLRLDGAIPDDLPFRYGQFLPAGSREQVLVLRDDLSTEEGIR